MRTTTIGRSVAIMASAALLASLTVATVAAPASAAKPKCAGKTATIVGTARSETIRGTAKADVIVAKGGNDVVYGRGGNDTVCGGPGHDRILGAGGKDVLLGQGGRDKLYGGAGRDRLLGGPANDRLAGGPGNDACLQGTGTGPRLSCERPAPPPAPPAPTPPPPAPTPPPPPTLAIAYGDINNNGVFDTGDVLISKLLDNDESGAPSTGDTVVMGKYPTSPNVITPAGLREAFEPWGVKTHTVITAAYGATVVLARTKDGGRHEWSHSPASLDMYRDFYDGQPTSYFLDRMAVNATDETTTVLASPSEPASVIKVQGPGTGDDPFIDVIIYP